MEYLYKGNSSRKYCSLLYRKHKESVHTFFTLWQLRHKGTAFFYFCARTQLIAVEHAFSFCFFAEPFFVERKDWLWTQLCLESTGKFTPRKEMVRIKSQCWPNVKRDCTSFVSFWAGPFTICSVEAELGDSAHTMQIGVCRYLGLCKKGRRAISSQHFDETDGFASLWSCTEKKKNICFRWGTYTHAETLQAFMPLSLAG